MIGHRSGSGTRALGDRGEFGVEFIALSQPDAVSLMSHQWDRTLLPPHFAINFKIDSDGKPAV